MPSTVYLVKPLTEACQDWLDENVGGETMWWCGGLAVEHGYLDNLMLGMESDGLYFDIDFTVIS